jgi:predicted nuclease of predicted toxin-antitoxin system
MRFLANAGVSPKTVDFLKQLGHEAVHVRTLGLERAADGVLIDRALADSSVVVTFDLDFGDILALGVLDKPSVIICRLADERADSVNQRLAQVLSERISDLESGALILIEDTRYRVRKLPFGRTWITWALRWQKLTCSTREKATR